VIVAILCPLSKYHYFLFWLFAIQVSVQKPASVVFLNSTRYTEIIPQVRIFLSSIASCPIIHVLTLKLFDFLISEVLTILINEAYMNSISLLVINRDLLKWTVLQNSALIMAGISLNALPAYGKFTPLSQNR
jgi:hypothetical protein